MSFQSRDLMTAVLTARQGFAREAGLQLCDDVTRQPSEDNECDDVTRRPSGAWDDPGLDLAHLQQQLRDTLATARV